MPENVAGKTTLTVAAASDLQFALPALVHEFRAAHPSIRVETTFGSSGNFFAQIRNGAPFDLYLSADAEYPRRLATEGLADGEMFLYAIGHIVLWVPNASPVDVERLGIAALSHPAVKRIAIANPQHAPYGRAAVAALRSLGAWEEAEPKLVLGENISQAAQFAESGAADIGILALSLACAPPMESKGRRWEIPLSAYPTLEQGGMVLRSSRHLEAARTLRDFLLSEPGRATLERYGLSNPPQPREGK